MKQIIISLLKLLDHGSALACRLTQWTGKAAIPTHPKHLVDFGQLYYLNKLEKTDKVLDLGCHAGEHTLKAARRVSKVVGVDINAKLITQARDQAKSTNQQNTQFIKHNLEKKLLLKANSFDKVFFFAVLEHLQNRNQVLKEIKRVLKPQGFLFISVPNKDSQWKKTQRSVGLSGFSDPDHKLEFSQPDIIKLLKRHKFTNINIQTTAVDTPLAGLIDLIGGISLSAYKTLMYWKINKGNKHPNNTVGFLITASNV